MKYILTLSLLLMAFYSEAQVLTKEDSLNAGLMTSEKATVLSGYGEAKVNYDLRTRKGVADLTRTVLFFGHRFNDKISFFSEMELEHAFIEVEENGEAKGGELAMEQLFLKFNLNKQNYLVTGLFIPRIGITNENHLPTTYNGNDRPFVEQLIIPTTWREMGVSLYGSSTRISGFNYSLSLMNGLDASKFESGNGIRNGRGQGSRANARNMAVTASALYYRGNWRMQLSGYLGGSAGLSKREADSLQLSYGAFGTPVQLLEADIQYLSPTFTFKATGAWLNIPEAFEINRAYAGNTPQSALGGYAEIAYNLASFWNTETKKNFSVFARYEWMDMDSKIPKNGIEDDIHNIQFVVAGVIYQPVRGVALKADYVYRITGEPNPALVVSPFPQALPYYTTNGYFNLGMAYSF